MSQKAINKLIASRPWIAHIDDEREIGNSIIVTLHEPYCFINDPTCGVRGFDTFAELRADTTKHDIYPPFVREIV